MRRKTLMLVAAIVGFTMTCFPDVHAQNHQKLIYNQPFAPSAGLINKYEKTQRLEL